MADTSPNGAAQRQRIIIGIDPGTNLLGFAVVRVEGGKPVFEDMGVLDLRKEKDPYEKLRQIYDTVSEVIKTYHGTEMALEAPFYGKNAQSLIKLGRAQGSAMIAALEKGLPVREYAPNFAKMSITGNGSASKEQVANMLQMTLGFDLKVEHLDATDALAIAMCHYYQTSSPLAEAAGPGGKRGGKGSGRGSWEDFVKDNPDRVK